ncbi:transporter substrate-binding domain-containing protein [Aeromonas jandaei]|nr:transporter substrate-binding domain-containing protein [Aeromonas jandaei]
MPRRTAKTWRQPSKGRMRSVIWWRAICLRRHPNRNKADRPARSRPRHTAPGPPSYSRQVTATRGSTMRHPFALLALLVSLARSPEREQSLRFSHPLGAASWGFFVHSESPEPALTRETLSGAIVGVTRNSFSQYLLEELDRRLQQQGNVPLHIRLNTTDSIHSLQKLTRNSRYQLYFSNVDVARYYLASGSHQDIRPCR